MLDALIKKLKLELRTLLLVSGSLIAFLISTDSEVNYRELLSELKAIERIESNDFSILLSKIQEIRFLESGLIHEIDSIAIANFDSPKVHVSFSAYLNGSLQSLPKKPTIGEYKKVLRQAFDYHEFYFVSSRIFETEISELVRLKPLDVDSILIEFIPKKNLVVIDSMNWERSRIINLYPDSSNTITNEQVGQLVIRDKNNPATIIFEKEAKVIKGLFWNPKFEEERDRLIPNRNLNYYLHKKRGYTRLKVEGVELFKEIYGISDARFNTLYLEDAIAECQDEIKKLDSKLTLIGLNLSREFASIFGSFIIFGVLCSFIIHLDLFSSKYCHANKTEISEIWYPLHVYTWYGKAYLYLNVYFIPAVAIGLIFANSHGMLTLMSFVNFCLTFILFFILLGFLKKISGDVN